MIPSENVQMKVAEWREKARAGTLTKEEMRDAIVFLRAERTAGVATAAKAKASAKPAVSVDTLFGELDGL